MTTESLPRPEALTPFRVGPCASGDPAKDDWYIEDAEGYPIGQADAGVVASMAALPAWIALADERGRRMDAVREFCAHGIAQRKARVSSRMTGMREATRLAKEARLLRDLLALLDGEGDQ